MTVGSLLELAGETFAHAEWVALFLGGSGLYALWLGGRGLTIERTRGFGWGASAWTGAAARFAARIWIGAGTALVLTAAIVWMLKA